MADVQAITAGAAIFGSSVLGNSTGASAASLVNLFSPGLFGEASTIVQLSGMSQTLAATATFQDQLTALQPGTASSGGGQGFGDDLTSFAAEVQGLVAAFNGVQRNLASINTTAALFGGTPAATTSLAQVFADQAQATFDNAGSSLTTLAQIGIDFQVDPAGGGSLSINLDTLEAAFASDPEGAFSLLAQAATTLADLAGSVAEQTGAQLPVLQAQALTSTASRLFSNDLLLQGQSSGTTSLAFFLALQSLGQAGGNGGITLQQSIVALNQFNIVSMLSG